MFLKRNAVYLSLDFDNDINHPPALKDCLPVCSVIDTTHCLLTALDSDTDADPPLAHKAAADGDVPLLVQAIKRDPGVLQQRDREGVYTLLEFAMIADGF